MKKNLGTSIPVVGPEILAHKTATSPLRRKIEEEILEIQRSNDTQVHHVNLRYRNRKIMVKITRSIPLFIVDAKQEIFLIIVRTVRKISNGCGKLVEVVRTFKAREIARLTMVATAA